MTFLSQWPYCQITWLSRPVMRYRLYYFLFAIYTGIAMLWLLVGLLPILLNLYSPLNDLILLRLEQIGDASYSAEAQLLHAIRLARYQYGSLSAVVVQYVFSAANIVLAILLVRLRPGDRVAWLLALGLVGTGAIFNMQSHVLLNRSTHPWLHNIHELLHFTSGVAYSFALLLFPTGSLPPSPFPTLYLPSRLDWPLRIAFILFIVFFGWTMIGVFHGEPATFVVFFGILVPIIGGLAQLFRYRRAMSEAERQQTRTLLFTLLMGAGMATAIWGMVWLASFSEIGLSPQVKLSLEPAAFIIFPLLFTAIPILLTFIVLRYRLWEVNLVINRSLIYGTLTALIVAIYVFVVAGVDTLLQERLPWIPSALGVGMAAILAQPLRERVQSGINRLMYGERDDPFSALARLGHRLEAVGSAEGVLPAIAETVARTLKLPYVAIAVQTEGTLTPVAAYGAFVQPIEAFPLIDHGELVGQLWAAYRSPTESFQRADRRLLENLARQAGPAVHAVLLAQALQRSRLHLVTAREEERRRLRRDLHDGLGPQLASLRLKVDAIRNNLDKNPAKSDQLLLEVREQIGAAIADVRRAVYGLRPPALDQLGLISAIHEYVRSQGEQNGLEIVVIGPEILPPLPAAIEVAAYHVVLGGLTNILCHAQAHHAYVGICLSGALHLIITDDGIGLPPRYQPGVGLTSMRERVAELGGSFTIVSTADAGTRIEVSLPLPDDLWAGVPASVAGDHVLALNSEQSEH